MTFYSEMAQVATELLTEFGSDIVLSRKVLSPYYVESGYVEEDYYEQQEIDPVTGEALLESEIQTYTLKGIMKKYPENVIDGSRITSSDRQVMIETSVVKPVMTDKLTINGQSWPIMEIESINPAGTELLYIVRVRR